jgi:hypothetical protein
MQNVAGVFRSVDGVKCVVERLRAQGFPEERINALAPGTDPAEIDAKVRVSDTEQPGMGGALGGTVGAAIGAAGGLELGATAASLLVPGIGPVLAIGIIGAALFGAGGAVAGAVLGNKLEDRIDDGIPHDELFVYEDALRRGRSVVFISAENDTEAESLQTVFSQCGAESIDAARDEWWVGLRDDERLRYEATGASFETDEPGFRRGFEASLHTKARGKSYDEDLDRLRDCFGPACEHAAFRAGYLRGRAYESSRKVNG